MEVYPLTNTSDYEHFMIYDNSYSDTCPDGCEVDDEDVVMATYVLELVLMPLVGAVGVLGNLLSIIVLYKSDQKTTFQHVNKNIYQIINTHLSKFRIGLRANQIYFFGIVDTGCPKY